MRFPAAATLWLFAVPLLPAVVFVAGKQSSYATGLAFAAVICAAGTLLLAPSLRLRLGDTRRIWAFAGAATVFLLGHSMVAVIANDDFNIERAAASFALLGFEVIAAFLCALILHEQKQSTLKKQLWLIVGAFTIIALASAVVPAIGPWADREKPVPPFSEPSHFALSLTVFYVACSVWARSWTAAAILASSAVMIAAVNSVTLLAVFALGFMCRARFLLSVVTAAAVAAVISAGIDVSYYLDRIAISEDTDNLSALVWLQGWEQAIGAIESSNGVGAGFQQFGLSGDTYSFADRILELSGDFLNINDGGTLASKLIGELGYAGMVVVLAYAVVAFRCLRRLRRAKAQQLRAQFILGNAMILSLAIEMFVRSIGYFSVGVFFAIAGAFLLRLEQRPPS